MCLGLSLRRRSLGVEEGGGNRGEKCVRKRREAKGEARWRERGVAGMARERGREAIDDELEVIGLYIWITMIVDLVCDIETVFLGYFFSRALPLNIVDLNKSETAPQHCIHICLFL